MNPSSEIKVCHFTSAHPADDVRIFHKECKSLASTGFSVFLVACNCKSEVRDNVNFINVEVPASGRLTRIFKTSRLVYKKALSIDADVYHFHDPELLLYALKLKGKGKKVIYDAHEDVPKQILGKFWINKYLRRTVAFSFRIFENFVASRLDYIVTATPFISERFSKVNKSCTDINNFPLLSELSEETPWEKKKDEICYIGAISEIRGILQFVESLEYLKNIKANIAGKFSPQSLKNIAMQMKGWEKVNDLGFVNRKETIKIMERSKVGIVTFLPLPNHVDAQPNKMFEYMSAAIPVVGSHFLPWKDILEKNDCGICVNPENPKEISEAINLLIEDGNRAEKMGKNGRKAVIEKYNWSVEEKKLIDVYLKLVG